MLSKHLKLPSEIQKLTFWKLGNDVQTIGPFKSMEDNNFALLCQSATVVTVYYFNTTTSKLLISSQFSK